MRIPSSKNIGVALVLGLALVGTSWAGSLEPDPRQGNFVPRLTLPDVGTSFHLQNPQENPGLLIVADAGKKSSLSLEDLGFSKEDTQSDPQFQKQLEARSDMLKIHQTLGLITCVPMVTTYILGLTVAKNDLMLHGTFGYSTAALYLTTASFAIFAPKPKGLKPSGNSELHQILAIVHGFFMVTTPLLGEFSEDNKDLKTLHLISATGLVTSYLAAMTVMTF